MVFDITQLRKIRKQLDMTQHKFAMEIGVSQSMIAKIEAGKLDPTYSYVKKIEDRIMHLTKRGEKEAKDIMNHAVFSIEPNEYIREAISLMNKHNISQIPVVRKSNVVGLISENSLLGVDSDRIGSCKISEIMNESPPIIDKHAKLEVIVQLLKFYSILIVKEAGKLTGVITKTDVIRSLSKNL